MPLSIKHPEADRLARELAARTGETLAEAVVAALKERLQRETGRSRVCRLSEELARIGARCAALPVLDDLPEMSLPPSVFEVCPHCGSTDIEPPRWSKALKVASCLWLWLVLFYPTARHFEPTKCVSCNRRWHPQWMT